MDVRNELCLSFPEALIDALLKAYKEIEHEFIIGRWKASALDAGHFVEASRRMIEHSLFGKYTAIGKPLPGFTDVELKRYESATGEESYRLLIPYALKSIYNIRNKRGIGHLGKVSPNEMDATFILYSVKWVLAEFLRITSGCSHDETQGAIATIVERRIEVLWKQEDITRVLHGECSARDQVLVHLFDSSPLAISELQGRIEYRNRTNFRKILSRLHKSRLIEVNQQDLCFISPSGQIEAEEIISKLAQLMRT